MIEINEIFSDSDKRLAFWCDDVADTNDLAAVAENIIQENIGVVSVPAEIVPSMWAYLEKMNVKILTRFAFNSQQKDIDSEIYDLASKITSVFKKGADGVQMFIKMRDFNTFIEKISVVRDDLFFEHDLCVVMDVEDLDINNWDNIFLKLREIRANALVLTLREDMGNRSDFVGRVYGLLQNWNMDGELHFILNNNFDRMDQAIRLVEILKPELSQKLRFFLNY